MSSISSTLKKHLGSIEIEESIHNLCNQNHQEEEYSTSIVENVFESIADSFLDQGFDVGLGSYIWNSQICVDLINRIRNEGYDNNIIVGGPEISFQQNLNEYQGADFLVKGYGEAPLLQYYQGYEIDDIKGMYTFTNYTMNNNKNHHNEFSTNDIEILSSYILSEPEEFLNSYKLRYETKRGCFGVCSYCQHSGGTNKVIELPRDRILSEIELISSPSSKVKSISIIDPIFNTKGSHCLEFMEKFITEGYQGEIAFQCRLELINQQFINLLKDMKCHGIHPKVEAGIQTIHKNECIAINRVNNLEKCEEVMKELRKAKITSKIDLIYGLPEQTVSSFQESVDFVKETLKPSKICCWPLLLLNGSELHRKRGEWDLEVDYNEGYLMKVVRSKSFSYGEYCTMERIAEGYMSKKE